MTKYYLALMASICMIGFIACDQSSGSGISIPGINVTQHAQGNGDKPNPGDNVFFHVDMYDHTGKKLQSTRTNPDMPSVKIPEDESAKSNLLVRALSQSSVGDSMSLFIPFDSLPGLPPTLKGTEIKYEMAVKDVMNADEYLAYTKEKQAAQLVANQENQKVAEEKAKMSNAALADYNAGKTKARESASGLKYVILEEGRGDNATNGSNVSVNYYGMLPDGTRFDDSFSRGRSFDFTVGQGSVIKGWDEGLTYANVGSRILLDIPAELGYGERGSPPVIPPNSSLIFIIEVDAIN